MSAQAASTAADMQKLLQSIGADDPNAGRAVQLQGEILTKINAKSRSAEATAIWR
jgi:hypothetical protein